MTERAELQHPYEAARRGVTDNKILLLIEQTFQHLFCTAESQPEPNAALKRLMATNDNKQLMQSAVPIDWRS